MRTPEDSRRGSLEAWAGSVRTRELRRRTVKVYYDSDVEQDILTGRKVAIIGYGNQARIQLVRC